MFEIIFVFAAIVAILLIAAFIADKLNINNGANKGVTVIPTNKAIYPVNVPLEQPPFEYWWVLWLLRRCIEANYLKVGLCRPQEYSEQNCASPGRWIERRNDGVVIFWYQFDYIHQETAPINPRKIADCLNKVLPNYCYAENVPLIRIATVRPIDTDKVEIGVMLA